MASFNLNDYETVETRLARFWTDHPQGQVITEMIINHDGQFMFKATIYRNDGSLIATGYAEEQVTTRGVNQTSAAENCETSAIGRALANGSYAAKAKRPSREEMEKVQRGQVVTPPELSPKHTIVKAALTERFPDEPMSRKSYMESVLNREVRGYSDLLPEEIDQIINALAVPNE